ncbi:type IV secretory system conjugative DNA transfer family protein [Salinibacillus xinjiangensis]|uniref:ATP-binding protein n=1 Tax=Salinibacillus xinjiangensis TaxID=1229268 RepID=A0A6G1X7S9_9BACI|nr:ATP-binding protein [Salinibacillus xinjiangensis]MRG87024.1 ATP-binding protein [Salinibacillus xinjiangensis]
MELAWQGATLQIRFSSVQRAIPKVEGPPKLSVKVNHQETPFKFVKSQPKQENIPKYKTFQLIPHSNVKNQKVDQFADILADTYEELFERWNKGLLKDPERVFFETEITNKSYKTFITTNTDLVDVVKQQSQLVWKHVTMNDEEPKKLNPEDCLCFNIKLKYPFFLSLKTDRSMQQIPLEELLEISRFMQHGDKTFIQFGIQSAEEQWYKDAEKEREEFENKPPKRWNKEFSRSTEIKPSHFGFDFVLRVVVQSKDERRKRRIARGIILALKQLNQDNELKEKMVKPKKISRFLEDVERHHIPIPFIFGKRQIIAPPEIAHFIKLPQRNLQDEYPIIETVNGREIDIPDSLKKDGIRIGDVTFKGKKQTAYMPIRNHDELCLPRIVIGGMGSGKTRGFGANWIVQSVQKGYGALAIDPAKGEIGDEVQSALPSEKVERIRLGSVPIALDWCEVNHSSRAKNRLANTIIGFFNTSTDETGAQTSRYIRAAVMAMQTGKLSEIIQIFEDEEYRNEVIEDMRDSIHKMTLEDFSAMSESKRAQILAPILNRLDTILGDEYLAECMDSDQSLDMVDLMSQRKAFIIDVPKSELGPEAVDLIVNLLSTKIDLAMTLRKESNQFPFFVVFDEPHQFLKSSKTWKSATVESRKWRVGYVWMFHSWEQIPRNLGEIIKAAGPHYHIYPSSKKTFSDLSEEIVPFTVENALKLKRFHAINIIRSSGEVVKPFIAKMSVPPSLGKD